MNFSEYIALVFISVLYSYIIMAVIGGFIDIFYDMEKPGIKVDFKQE